jgi:hypothetical protein
MVVSSVSVLSVLMCKGSYVGPEDVFLCLGALACVEFGTSVTSIALTRV